MPVIPATGTCRVLVRVVASRDGDFQQGVNSGNCAADIKPSMSSPDIEAYLEANGGNPITAPNARSTNALFCDPVCFGLFPVSGLHRLTFNPLTEAIIFNPGGSQEVIDFLSGDFPGNLLISNLQVHFLGDAVNTGGAGNIVDFTLLYNGLNALLDASPNIIDDVVESPINAVIPSGETRGFLSGLGIFGVGVSIIENTIVENGCGVFATAQASFIIRELYVQFDYEQWTSNLELSPGVTSEPYTTNSPAGTIFEITADDDLDTLTELEIFSLDGGGDLFGGTLIPAENILIQTPTVLRFVMPPFALGSSGSRLLLFAEGTQFGGQIYVGDILPVLVNGSGIYNLIPGKKHDTYYDRDTDPVSTVNMTIPRPFGRTGLV